MRTGPRRASGVHRHLAAVPAAGLVLLGGSSPAAGPTGTSDHVVLASVVQRVEREHPDLHDHKLVDLGTKLLEAGAGYLVTLVFESARPMDGPVGLTLIECRVSDTEVGACRRRDAVAGPVDAGSRTIPGQRPLLDPPLRVDPPLPDQEPAAAVPA